MALARPTQKPKPARAQKLQAQLRLVKAPSRQNSTGGGSRSTVMKSMIGGNQMVSAPGAYSVQYKSSIPKFVGSKSTGCRIRHREYLLDLVPISNFFCIAGAINPGIQTMFPWLSNLAPSFETYRFHYLRFVYEPQCASSAAGCVMLGIDYDPADAYATQPPGGGPFGEPNPLSTKGEVLSLPGAVMTSIWNELSMVYNPPDSRALGPSRFVRTGALASGADVKTYDCGTLQIGLQNGSGTGQGSLFVEYDVEFFSANFSLSQIAAMHSARYASVSGETPIRPLGANPSYTNGGNLVVTGGQNGSGQSTLTFSTPGQYLIDYILNGTTLTGAPSTSGSTAAISSNSATTNAAATQTRGTITAQAQKPGDFIVIDASAVAATITSASTKIATYLASLF